MPAVQKALIHLSQFTCDIAGLLSLSWTATRNQNQNCADPETQRAECSPSDTSSATQWTLLWATRGADRCPGPGSQGGSAALPSARKTTTPASTGYRAVIQQWQVSVFIYYTKLHSKGLVGNIQRQKSKQILKNKQAHIRSCWWNTWEIVTEISTVFYQQNQHSPRQTQNSWSLKSNCHNSITSHSIVPNIPWRT